MRRVRHTLVSFPFFHTARAPSNCRTNEPAMMSGPATISDADGTSSFLPFYYARAVSLPPRPREVMRFQSAAARALTEPASRLALM